MNTTLDDAPDTHKTSQVFVVVGIMILYMYALKANLS